MPKTSLLTLLLCLCLAVQSSGPALVSAAPAQPPAGGQKGAPPPAAAPHKDILGDQILYDGEPGSAPMRGGSWTAGLGGTILQNSVGTWFANTSPVTQTLRALTTSGDKQVWAAGDQGVLLHLDPASLTWQSDPSPTTHDLTSLSATASYDIWAAGKHGVVLHSDGKTWKPVTTNLTADLYAIAALGPKDVWAAGAGGLVAALHRRRLGHPDGPHHPHPAGFAARLPRQCLRRWRPRRAAALGWQRVDTDPHRRECPPLWIGSRFRHPGLGSWRRRHNPGLQWLNLGSNPIANRQRPVRCPIRGQRCGGCRRPGNLPGPSPGTTTGWMLAPSPPPTCTTSPTATRSAPNTSARSVCRAPASRVPVQPGSGQVLRLQPDPWHAPALFVLYCAGNASVDFTAYDSLDFSFRLSSGAVNDPTFWVASWQFTSKTIHIQDYIEGSIVDSQWRQVHIPLADLESPGWRMSDVQFLFWNTDPAQPTYDVDNITLRDTTPPTITLRSAETSTILRLETSERYRPDTVRPRTHYALTSPDDPAYAAPLQPEEVALFYHVVGLDMSASPVNTYQFYLRFSEPLHNGSRYNLHVENVANASGIIAPPVDFSFIYNDRTHLSENIKLNQEGYLPAGPKLGHIGGYLGDMGGAAWTVGDGGTIFNWTAPWAGSRPPARSPPPSTPSAA